LEHPTPMFAVTGEGAASSRFETRPGLRVGPIVGRDQELALLQERWSRALAGEGQGVLLAGEAGIGKSRLVRALLDALREQPQVQRARTLAVLTDQLLGLAARRPVLVVLEDAHWIDPTTLDLMEMGLDQIGSARVMMLLTSRPDGEPPLAAHPHITRLTLNRL